MHVPDGAPFSSPYGPSVGEPEVAIGWLEGGRPYERGEVSADFIAALRELCRAGINRTRGFQGCTLCPPNLEPSQLAPTMVGSDAGEFVVGSAEIRVPADGYSYAAPDMVIHYVEAHGYRPPHEFVAAVLALGGRGRGRFREPGL